MSSNAGGSMEIYMRAVLVLLASVFCVPLTAQNVLFEEHFEQGLPSTWSQVQLGFGSDRWLTGTSPSTSSPDVFHEYFCNHGTLFRDNRLVTPRISLRGLGDAMLRWEDEQVLPTWRLLNEVEVSVANGPFVPLFRVTGTTSGTTSMAIDLSAYLGRSDLRFAFHYQGDIANEWRIDHVRVTTTQPIHRVADLRTGRTAQFSVSGATPGSVAMIFVSLQGAGPLPVPFELVYLSLPIALLSAETVTAQGTSSISVPIPLALPGLEVWSQGAELSGGTLRWTNALAMEVR
jgi:hypothetical protein